MDFEGVALVMHMLVLISGMPEPENGGTASNSTERPGRILGIPGEVYVDGWRLSPTYKPRPKIEDPELKQFAEHFDKVLLECNVLIRNALKSKKSSQLVMPANSPCAKCELQNYINVRLFRWNLTRDESISTNGSLLYSVQTNFDRYGALCQCDSKMLQEHGIVHTTTLITRWYSSKINFLIDKPDNLTGQTSVLNCSYITDSNDTAGESYEFHTAYPAPSVDKTGIYYPLNQTTTLVTSLEVALKQAMCSWIKVKMGCAYALLENSKDDAARQCKIYEQEPSIGASRQRGVEPSSALKMSAYFPITGLCLIFTVQLISNQFKLL